MKKWNVWWAAALALGAACGSNNGMQSSADAGPGDDGGTGGDGGGSGSSGSGGTLVLYGGDAGSCLSGTAGDCLGDAWQWDGAHWTQLAGTEPGGLASAAMTALDGQLFLFSGYDGTSWTNDLWNGNGASWAESAGPDELDGPLAATLAGNLVVLGAEDFGEVEGNEEVWIWGGSNTWSGPPSDLAPDEREGAVVAPLGDKLVLFGGDGGLVTTYLGDTWTWDGTSWTQVASTGPSARSGAVMAPLGDKLVLFGGFVDNTMEGARNYGDTWTWDGTAWTQVASTGPSERGFAAMAPLGDKLVLFGGYDDNGPCDDTWTWDGTSWTQVPVSGPSARASAAFAALP